MVGGDIPEGYGTEILEALDTRFQTLEPADIDLISGKFGGDYVLISSEKEMGQSLVYRNDDWSVFVL